MTCETHPGLRSRIWNRETRAVVICAFPDAHLTKTRPAVVLSAQSYHDSRGDVILGVVTSPIPAAPATSEAVTS